MVKGVLVETGFLIALNPRDKNHEWALQLLKQAKEGIIRLYISSPAILELTLILRSRGIDDKSVETLLESMNIAIRLYAKPNYTQVTLESATLASKLRQKYPDLTFFDSYHAALAITNNLEYYDLDPVVQKVVSRESKP